MYVYLVTQSVQLLETPWTGAQQAPLSMRFPSVSQEHWSGLLFPPPEDLANPGIQSMSSASPPLVGKFFTTEPPGKLRLNIYFNSVLVSTTLLVPC